MNRAIVTILIVCCILTGCSSSKVPQTKGEVAEAAAWAALTPLIFIAIPVIVVGGLGGAVISSFTQDERAKEWQTEFDHIYLERIRLVSSWSPVDDATHAWEKDAFVYWWKSGGTTTRLTGLISKSENMSGELVEIDQAAINSIRQVRLNDPEMVKRTEMLYDEIPGVTYVPAYRGVVYACYEETVAKYRYMFNVQMANLTGDYAAAPDYDEDIGMKFDQPCAQIELE